MQESENSVVTRKTTLVSLAATTALTLVGTATAAQASDDEMVTDRLGTHSSSAVDMPPDSSGTNQLYAASSCGTWSNAAKLEARTGVLTRCLTTP